MSRNTEGKNDYELWSDIVVTKWVKRFIGKYSILYWIFGGGGAVIGLISVGSFEAY